MVLRTRLTVICRRPALVDNAQNKKNIHKTNVGCDRFQTCIFEMFAQYTKFVCPTRSTRVIDLFTLPRARVPFLSL